MYLMHMKNLNYKQSAGNVVYGACIHVCLAYTTLHANVHLCLCVACMCERMALPVTLPGVVVLPLSSF